MIAVLLCVILRQWDGLTSQSTKSLLHKPSSDFSVYIILKVLSSQSFPLSATLPAYLEVQAWTSDSPQEEGCALSHISLSGQAAVSRSVTLSGEASFPSACLSYHEFTISLSVLA